MIQNRYKLRSQAVCQSVLVSCVDSEHHNKEPVLENNELGLSTNNMRRSARLQNKERVTSCSQHSFIPERNGIKCKIVSSNSSYGMKKSDFSSKLGASYVPQVDQKNINDDLLLAETADASSKSSTSVPSLEFHVRSEEGIKLVVDLNSSPSDWSQSLENEVCPCQKFQKRKFQCFRQELEYLGNSNNLVRSSLIKTTSDCATEGHIQIVLSQHSIHKENDQPAVDDGSSRFSVTKAYGATTQVAVSSEKEKEVPFLSASGVSNTECCPRVGQIETPDSVVHNALQENGCSPSPVNPKKSSKYSRTMEEQRYKNNLTLAVSQGFGEEHNNKDSLDSENICSLDLVDTMNTMDIENSCSLTINDFVHSLYGNHTSENWEIQNDISVPSENWSELMLSSTHKRKSHHLKSDFTFGLHAGRILRSTKHFKGLILRRSKRLVS